MEHKIAIAHDPTGSRIYDALLESPTVPPKAKRQFIMDFLGHYHELVDDRIGSRVGDRCWSTSDTYLKEKVARSLIPYETQLAGSFYGKFFARNLNLYLLQRKPDEWRNVQTQRKQQQQQQATPALQKQQATVSSATSQTKAQEPPKDRGKKRSKPSDEIEELFEKTLGKRVKKAALGTEVEKPQVAEKAAVEKEEKKKRKKDAKSDKDRELDSVLGAIKSAPKHEDGGRPKKKHKRA